MERSASHVRKARSSRSEWREYRADTVLTGIAGRNTAGLDVGKGKAVERQYKNLGYFLLILVAFVAAGFYKPYFSLIPNFDADITPLGGEAGPGATSGLPVNGSCQRKA